MRIAIHPRLVEDAVFHACRAAESRGDDRVGEWLHRSLERAYRLPEGADRDRRFGRVHGVAFRLLGLAKALHAVVAAHPPLARAEGPFRVGPAPGRAGEGIDLYARSGPDGRTVRSVVASVLPSTLADPAEAARRLHRDASKTADLLDPAFAWTEGPAEPTPARRESMRLRYRAAWDAWTDGRLERRGLPAPVSREKAAEEFAAMLGGALGPAGTGAAFERLRTARALTHGDLQRFARDPGALPGEAPSASEAGEVRSRAAFAPGSPCPFCRFPTHDWVREPGHLSEPIREALCESLPGWSPEDGICGQCALLFRSRPAPHVRGGPGGSASESNRPDPLWGSHRF